MQHPYCRQWLDGVEQDWTLLALQFAGRAVATQRSLHRRELVNRKDGGLPDGADLVVRALALLEGFAAYPVGAPPHRRTSAGCEVLRLKSPPRQLPYAPRATGDMGRASGPTGQGQATAEAVQRVASGMPQNTPGQPRQRAGGHAPQPAGPSDAARPNRTLSAAASNAAPAPPRNDVRSTRNRHKSIILRGYSAQFWKSTQLLQQYLPTPD